MKINQNNKLVNHNSSFKSDIINTKNINFPQISSSSFNTSKIVNPSFIDNNKSFFEIDHKNEDSNSTPDELTEQSYLKVINDNQNTKKCLSNNFTNSNDQTYIMNSKIFGNDNSQDTSSFLERFNYLKENDLRKKAIVKKTTKIIKSNKSPLGIISNDIKNKYCSQNITNSAINLSNSRSNNITSNLSHSSFLTDKDQNHKDIKIINDFNKSQINNNKSKESNF